MIPYLYDICRKQNSLGQKSDQWLQVAGTSYSEGVKEAFDNPGSISYLDYYVTQLYLAKLIALHI